MPMWEDRPFWQRQLVSRRGAAMRSLAFLFGCGFGRLGMQLLHDPKRSKPWSIETLMLTDVPTVPVVVAVTNVLTMVADENGWFHRPDADDLRMAVLGTLAGAGAFGAMVVVANTQGWVEVGPWGWETASKRKVAQTVLSHLGVLSGAWNEEMVFRGYGLHVFSQVVGEPLAAAFLTWYFGYVHGDTQQIKLGSSALGLALLALRYAGDGLWLPTAYHFGWNYMQTAILGAPEMSPSVRPIRMTGPYRWTGKPAYPEPGILSSAVNLVVAAVAGWFWWRKRRKR